MNWDSSGRTLIAGLGQQRFEYCVEQRPFKSRFVVTINRTVYNENISRIE